MKKHTILLPNVLLTLLCTFVASGQIGVVTGNSSTPVIKGLKGFPYSAESSRENVKTLADGNTIIETVKTLEYRDGEGRTRREDVSQSNPRPYSFTSVNIFDPVAGYSYSLNTQEKTAFRLKLTPPATATISAIPPPTGQTSSQEQLGSRIIDGIETTGSRITTIIAPGTVGNEKEIRRVFENWYSEQLRLSLLTISDDPRYGIATTRLTNIKRDEPDKSLFEIPADYKIIDREPLRPTIRTLPSANRTPTEIKKP